MGKKTNDMQKARDEKNLRQKLADETGYAKATIRDARAIGCTEAQIMAVKNEEALRALIVNVDPKKVGAMPVAALKEAAKPITPAEPVNMKQETARLNIAISPQVALTWKRGDYEQSALDHFVNRSHIVKQRIVRVIINRKYVANKTSKYETDFEVVYKEPT
jgi:hypothetical protein